jgi:hypothetical protein
VDNFEPVYLEILEHQRKLLIDMNRNAKFDEELIRKHLSFIDMEELKKREKNIQEPEPPVKTNDPDLKPPPA